jgi:transcriptional regulator with XRE-family HTH domain
MDSNNIQFIAMVKLSGWSQAEVARQLGLTPGAVSQMFHGKTRPGPRTLHLFKMILTKQDHAAFKRFEKMPMLEPREWEVIEYMRRLHQAQRERFFEALKLLVKAFSSSQTQRA